jgi:flagellar assembly protein FliH
MHRFREGDIKPFSFSDLQGTHVVTRGDFTPFSFNELSDDTLKKNKVSDETIRSERIYEKKNNFKIDNIVRECRGLSKQEQNDLEQSIQEEVNKRLEIAYQDAFNEGVALGKEEGKNQAFAEYQQQLDQKISDFMEVITSLQEQTSSISTNSKTEIYEFVKRFTKWIVLKEINEQVYLENLLEKLLLELNVRKNLIIKVGKNNFKQMPEVIQIVEARLGQLSNVRIEVVPEINHPGIILEAENGLIDGTIEGVFQNIDKIFQQVVKHE